MRAFPPPPPPSGNNSIKNSNDKTVIVRHPTHWFSSHAPPLPKKKKIGLCGMRKCPKLNGELWNNFASAMFWCLRWNTVMTPQVDLIGIDWWLSHGLVYTWNNDMILFLSFGKGKNLFIIYLFIFRITSL